MHMVAEIRARLARLGTRLEASERGLGVVADALSGAGPLTRGQLPPPQLLSAYDHPVMGWGWRHPTLGDHQGWSGPTSSFRASALVVGRAGGTWGPASRAVPLRPFGRFDNGVRASLAQDAQAVVAFLGLPGRPMIVPAASRSNG